MNTLYTPQVSTILEQLHSLAANDIKTGLPSNNATRFMAVSAEQGKFLNFLAGVTGAKHIVEFGCSFGISGIYLAAAAKDNGGTIITTEMEAAKVTAAAKNFEQAGLAEVIAIRQGDAMQTLADVKEDIDLLFLDGAKELYRPVFDMLRDKLAPGAVIIADNADKPETHPLVNYLLDAKDEYTSLLLFEGRMLVAYIL